MAYNQNYLHYVYTAYGASIPYQLNSLNFIPTSRFQNVTVSLGCFYSLISDSAHYLVAVSHVVVLFCTTLHGPDLLSGDLEMAENLIEGMKVVHCELVTFRRSLELYLVITIITSATEWLLIS